MNIAKKTKEINTKLEKVWVNTLQDVLISGDDVTSAAVYNTLKTEMYKFNPINRIKFNRKSINNILTFFKLLGCYRTPEMAFALKNMFLMLLPKEPRGKKVYLRIWVPWGLGSGCGYRYEEYPSIKKALEVYGRETWATDGVSAGIISRQLKKERNGEEHYGAYVYGKGKGGGDLYIKFSVNNFRNV